MNYIKVAHTSLFFFNFEYNGPFYICALRCQAFEQEWG